MDTETLNIVAVAGLLAGCAIGAWLYANARTRLLIALIAALVMTNLVFFILSEISLGWDALGYFLIWVMVTLPPLVGVCLGVAGTGLWRWLTNRK